LWQSRQLKPTAWRGAERWQLTQVEFGTRRCAAWYLPLWQVRQVMDGRTALAWARCRWQGVQTKRLVTPVECCALEAGPEPVPRWQPAQRALATFLRACRTGWQERHARGLVVAVAWWIRTEFVWHVAQATLPACCRKPCVWQPVQVPMSGDVLCTCCSWQPRQSAEPNVAAE
jgi:hypothetical protein